MAVVSWPARIWSRVSEAIIRSFGCLSKEEGMLEMPALICSKTIGRVVCWVDVKVGSWTFAHMARFHLPMLSRVVRTMLGGICS